MEYLQEYIRVQQTGITMVKIDEGDFVVGCADGQEESCYGDAQTAHLNAFEIGKTEVTQGQWKAVMGSVPPKLHFKDCGDSCPVESVSWDDVQIFIRNLNAQTGRSYRLPTESEWRAACLAGSPTKYCGGNNGNAVAWFYENSGSSDNKIHSVGQKQANAYGLYDMSGNVSEWVQDKYNNEDRWRVLRGGSWDDNLQGVRAADRGRIGASNRLSYVGFRLARTLP
ncbi:MAG: formylglycine-generating enzyme family protein [Gallionella sp.]